MAQHISIRIPWHDNGWKGCVCKNPERNQACRVLKNIALICADTNASQCASSAGEVVAPGKDFVPPCITESGQFMSNHEMESMRSHPYTYNEHFAHILDTKLDIPPFSFIGIPFNWTLKDKDRQVDSPNSRFFTGFDPSIETPITQNDSWISNGKNQKRIFEYFFRNVTPEKSIVVAYSKAVPFIENPGRIVMGIGFVESLGELREYDYSAPPKGKQSTACLWERKIEHSIRSDRSNGFLFPFDEIQSYLKDHPQQNPDDLVVFAPEEYREEFSYATEHLSHDALIQTLNKTITVLQKYKDICLLHGNGANWDDCIDWCQAQLQKTWVDRGAYPGLGAVLSALGVPFGFDVALALRIKYSDDMLWDNLVKGLENLSVLLPKEQKGILREFTLTQREDIADIIEERQSYLELLSRITLTLPQAQLLLDDNTRFARWLCNYADQLTDIHSKDISDEIVANPYLLYEKTYQLESKYQIGISKIDLAMFPPKFVVERFFSSDEDHISEPDDKRRLRAIIVSVLEREAANGSSLMLAGDVVEAVGKFRSDVPNIEPKMRLQNIQSKRRKAFFDELFSQFPIKVIPESGDEREETAIQLVRLQKVNGIIRLFVNDRIDGSINIQDNWSDLLATVLGKEQQSEEEREKAARDEKVVAIAKMARSRISVLTGGAGTGKTTTLAALGLSKAIQSEGILVLAPTGKARVVLSSKLREQNIPHTAKTLFEFLKSTKHCDIRTWKYHLSGKHNSETPSTVIIDECSMLTEEMFGALAEAIRGAKRVIFVGDPNQLPPIGTGKPFYELARKLKEQEGQPHYSNLFVSNRQKQGDTSASRLDVDLAKMFTEDSASSVGEDLFERITEDSDNIEFVHCQDADALPNIIEETLAKMGIADVDSFDSSLGGKLNGQWMNFADARSVERWQILSPYRNREVIGTRGINEFIQTRFRLPKPKKHRSTIKSLGTDGIRYAEKVINNQNQDRTSWKWGVWSRSGLSMDGCEKYIANGEIGIVRELKKDCHVVQFSSQVGYDYDFYSRVSEDDSQLELAYALTVHKAQGSGFKATIFVLIEPERGLSPLVTREMLYTALTRQSDKIFIIYNKQPSELKKYGAAELSDLAHRKTNLFGDAILRQVSNGWYDSKNIFITVDGTRVKSKSEVIVYNLLLASEKQPVYEQELHLNGITVHPDFTLETNNGTVYWEHLGMLGDYGYSKSWERKKKLYEKYGITQENGNLILSQDELTGGIDAQKIHSLITDKL
ncbi:MAG: AAA family ATPase [Hungatella sp.]|nr:AAA family ATPase [Hungatella sp.]